MQIVNVNNCHWVCVAKMNPNEYIIDLFDSNRQSYVYEDLGKQVLSFLPNDVTEVIFTSHNVQRQTGGTDCGLFALAFATAICFGDNVSNLIFDQSALRHHLKKCINTAMIEPFPHKIKRISNRSLDSGKITMSYTRAV